MQKDLAPFFLRSKRWPKLSTKLLLDIFPEKLGIYRHAKLDLVEINFGAIEGQEEQWHKDNFAIGFSLSGELKGQVICSTSITEAQQRLWESSFMEGLFIETMNILLGQSITRLDEQASLMVSLSSPKKVSKKTFFQPVKDCVEGLVQYQLQHKNEIYQCNLRFFLNEQELTVV